PWHERPCARGAACRLHAAGVCRGSGRARLDEKPPAAAPGRAAHGAISVAGDERGAAGAASTRNATMMPRRFDIGLALILLVALLARVDLANIRGYIHDEANTAIPLAETISFSPGSMNLPLRGENH